MSLLAGIKFVKREDRVNEDDMEKSKKRKKEHKNKKDKKQKKHDRKEKRDKEESDDDFDMASYVEEKDKNDELSMKRMSWMRNTESSESFSRYETEGNEVARKRITFEDTRKTNTSKSDYNFSDILTKLNNKGKIDQSYSLHKNEGNLNDQEFYDFDGEKSSSDDDARSHHVRPNQQAIKREEDNNTSRNVDAITKDNLSVAEKLKARLKQNVKTGISSTVNIHNLQTSTSNTPSTLVYGNYQDMAVQIAKKNVDPFATILHSSTSMTNSSEGDLDQNYNERRNKSSQIQTSKQRRSKDTEKEKSSTSMSSGSSLKEMIAFERLGGDDMDENYRENILRLGDNYKGTELGRTGLFGAGDQAGMDEEEDVDVTMFQRRDDRFSAAQREQREMQRAKRENKQHQRAVENCPRCMDSVVCRGMEHLVISTGLHTQLRMKQESFSIAPMHCEIFPLEHTSSTLKCEEDVQAELERFKGCLRSMFRQLGRMVVFTEVAVRLDGRPHMLIDVVPLAVDLNDDVKMFFKEALSGGNDDEECSTHKPLIKSLSEDKPLHRAIHPKFPYVAVEWDGGGMALVVENDRKFGPKFCLDVVAGVLTSANEDEEYSDGRTDARSRVQSKQHSGNDQKQIQQEKDSVKAFRRDWEMFDWTQYIDNK